MSGGGERATMYYVLACYGPSDIGTERTCVGAVLNFDASWQTGRRFEAPPASPIQINLDPDHPGMLIPMFDAGILLMSTTLVAAVQSAGVDNLDVYDAVLHDLNTGETHHTHSAVNIIGIVTCADMARSRHTAYSDPPIIDTDFDSLAIDEDRAQGLLMFRLAECVIGIVVHERVKRVLEAQQIPYLEFIPPERWIG